MGTERLAMTSRSIPAEMIGVLRNSGLGLDLLEWRARAASTVNTRLINN